jgi:hypothetical protein
MKAKTMKATSQYIKHLLAVRAGRRVPRAYIDAASAERSNLQRMHDLGLEPAKTQEPLPAWADAFGQKLQRYWGGGIEAEHGVSVG